jgi:hypothetical protein
MRAGVLVATFKQVLKSPDLYFSGGLPGAVVWELASEYRRNDEKPGTHALDIWGGRSLFGEGQTEVPTESNIARAAESAIRRLQNTRRRGRPSNPANQILADLLGDIFRRSNQKIVRRLEPVMRGDKLVWIECGRFYDFLNLVLSPLQQCLRERKLLVPPETIVRLVTQDFPAAR